MTENNGYIYILTNPSIPEFVKIGYADNLVNRLKTINSSTEVPLAFRLYAYYEVNKRLLDQEFHNIIDKLNPELRSRETINGKERKREFFAISKETAYNILEAIATISNTESRLHLCEEDTYSVKNEETDELDKIIDKTKYDKETFLSNKNPDIITIYEKICQLVKEKQPGVYEEATQNYIALRNEKGHNICEYHLLKSRLSIITREPNKEELMIGEKLPDTYLWSLNYRVYVNNKSDLDEKSDKIVKILLSAYEQIK